MDVEIILSEFRPSAVPTYDVLLCYSVKTRQEHLVPIKT